MEINKNKSFLKNKLAAPPRQRRGFLFRASNTASAAARRLGRDPKLRGDPKFPRQFDKQEAGGPDRLKGRDPLPGRALPRHDRGRDAGGTMLACRPPEAIGFPDCPHGERRMNKSQIPAAQKEVLSLLLDDHKKVKKLFKEFEAEKDGAAKERLAQEACTELSVHAKIEEEIFYPFLRDQNPKAFGDLLDEALVEHASAKELIAQIQGSSMAEELYEAKVTVLNEYVQHHVTEEEDELFPKVIAQKIDLRDILTPLVQRKEELMGSTAVA